MSLIIRRALPHDLDAVRRVLVETWHATYDTTLGREKVDEITSSWHSRERLARDLEEQPCLLVAEREGRLIGTASARRGCEGGLILSRLYVLPEAQGEGVGARLLAAVVAAFPEATNVSLEVERMNARAIAFYTRAGFAVTGSGTDCGGCGSNVPHVIMRKELNGA